MKENIITNTMKAANIVFLAILLAFQALILVPETATAVNLPELPRVYLNSQYPTQSAARTVYYVDPTCTGKTSCLTSLQAAIDAAKLGDEIVVTAGMQITGPITLKNKSVGDGWVVIRSSRMSELPGEGNRVNPSHASLMPKIVSPGLNQSALKTENKAHHYRLVGIEFAKQSPSVSENNLIALGEFDTPVLSDVANNIVLDRVYAHGDSTSNLRRCVALNSASTAIVDSHISDCHDSGADSQAIGGWNGPGPFKIVNNYLEGAGENFMLGGADPKIPNLVSSDIEFRGNYVFKPLTWKVGHATYAQKYWVVKNSFELKNAQRVLIEGNIFKNNWAGQGQSGYSIVFTPRNQDGGCPWCVVQDISFKNNIIESVDGGFNILGTDDIRPSVPTKRVLIQNNLLTETGTGFQTNGVTDLTIDHNSFFNSRNLAMAYGLMHTNFAYTNNISSPANYGFFGDASGEGNASLNKYFSGYQFQKNVVTGRSSSLYPIGNFFPANFDAVGFTEYPAGNYQLASTSSYKGAGTDGKDIGADYANVKATTVNVVSGSNNVIAPPPAPLPPPPPAPTPVPSPTPAPSSNQFPDGSFDGIASSLGIAKGWSYDPDSSSQSNPVHIYIDGPVGQGTLVAGITADLQRVDVNSAKGISGNHGFEYSIPSTYRNGVPHLMYVYGIDLNDSTKSTLLEGSPKSFTLGSIITPPPAPLPPPPAPMPAPSPTPPPSQLYPDATLIKDSNPAIYIIEYGKKRAFASMTVFEGLGFSTKHLVSISDASIIPSGEPILTAKMRHTRGVNVSYKGTVYFMGSDMRYPYPSYSVFKSWNPAGFKHVVVANSFDMQIPLGPIVQTKPSNQ